MADISDAVLNQIPIEDERTQLQSQLLAILGPHHSSDSAFPVVPTNLGDGEGASPMSVRAPSRMVRLLAMIVDKGHDFSTISDAHRSLLMYGIAAYITAYSHIEPGEIARVRVLLAKTRDIAKRTTRSEFEKLCREIRASDLSPTEMRERIHLISELGRDAFDSNDESAIWWRDTLIKTFGKQL